MGCTIDYWSMVVGSKTMPSCQASKISLAAANVPVNDNCASIINTMNQGFESGNAVERSDYKTVINSLPIPTMTLTLAFASALVALMEYGIMQVSSMIR
jgi:hypothetical protein